jgi:hypothetical protein
MEGEKKNYLLVSPLPTSPRQEEILYIKKNQKKIKKLKISHPTADKHLDRHRLFQHA